jgi:hypothetical protein
MVVTPVVPAARPARDLRRRRTHGGDPCGTFIVGQAWGDGLQRWVQGIGRHRRRTGSEDHGGIERGRLKQCLKYGQSAGHGGIQSTTGMKFRTGMSSTLKLGRLGGR